MSAVSRRQQAQIVIVGGGIAGCSVLFHLARRGVADVVLLERDELTSGSTWHAAGNVPTFSGSWGVMRMQAYSAELYRQLAADADAPISYHVTGSVRLAHTADRLAEFRHIAGMAHANGMAYEILTPEELVERYPFVRTHGLAGALWDPLDGDIDPSQVTQAMARAARAGGAEVRRFERVVGLEQHADRSWTVTTRSRDGVTDALHCVHVVNAAGYRAGEVMALLGRHHPIAHLSHQYLVTDEIPELAERAERAGPLPLLRDPDASYYLRQERNGYILGPYEWRATTMWHDGIPDEFANRLWADDIDRLAPQIVDAGERVPILASAGIARVVNGPIPYAPDGYPYLGPEHGLANFWHCNTFSFGIAQGGGAGKLLADWILDGRPAWDAWAVDRRRYKSHATTDYTDAKAREVYQNEYAVGFPFEERPAGRPCLMSPLYARLAGRGARFGARGGWERATWFDPVGVTSLPAPLAPFEEGVADPHLTFGRSQPWRPLVAEECRAARERVAVLDLPGFSKYDVSGPGATSFLDRLLCTRLPNVGRIGLCYALLPDGKVLSEFTVSRLADDRYYLVGAASAEWHDLDVLTSAMPADGSVRVANVTAERGSLVVVGPRSRDVLAAITTSALDNTHFPWLAVRDIDTDRGAHVGPVRALRVNYVGELGWELHASNDQLPALYDAVLVAGTDHGIQDIGIYAVDSLRLDKCYRGWKVDLEIGFSAFDAGLDRFVDLTKPDFVGKQALVAERVNGSPWCFVPLLLDESSELDAPFCASMFDGAERIGIVTSGGWSYTLRRSVALAYVRPQYAVRGTRLQIDVFGRPVAASVEAEPLYDPTNDRLRA